MRATFRTSKRVAKIRVRISARGLTGDRSVSITDVMLQPGASVSGWLPHVTELPWAAGLVGGGQ